MRDQDVLRAAAQAPAHRRLLPARHSCGGPGAQTGGGESGTSRQRRGRASALVKAPAPLTEKRLRVCGLPSHLAVCVPTALTSREVSPLMKEATHATVCDC